MLGVEVDRSDPAPLISRLKGGFVVRSLKGMRGPGDRLPPAKDMAAVLGVNTNTVLRALRQLRDEGLLELRRGHAIRIEGLNRGDGGVW